MKYFIFLSSLFCVASLVNAKEPQGKEFPDAMSGQRGQMLYRKPKQKALKNAFGGSDIFGRKVNMGYVEVYFMGMEGNTAKFIVNTQDIETNASTVTRSGFSHSTFNGKTKFENGAATTSGTVTSISAPQEWRIELPPTAMPVDLAFPEESEIVTADIHLKIVAVSPKKVFYQIIP